MIDPEPMFSNVVGSFDVSGDGKHLVLHGHIDRFGASDEGWSHSGPGPAPSRTIRSGVAVPPT